MWNALKGDVMDFVSTIQKDVALAIDEINTDLVKGDVSRGKEKDSSGSKNQSLIEEIASSRSTFTEEVHHHEYTSFRESFMIDDYAGEIARLLTTSGSTSGSMMGTDDFSYSTDDVGGDSQENITTYYSELVPSSLSQEEFWARYFFRVSKLLRTMSASASAAHLDTSVEDDEEENIPWDDDIPIGTTTTTSPPTQTEAQTQHKPFSGRAQKYPSLPSTNVDDQALARAAVVAEENKLLKAENESLFAENVALKGTVEELRAHVAALTAAQQVIGNGPQSEETVETAPSPLVTPSPAVNEDEVSGHRAYDDQDLLSSSTASLDSSVDGLVVVKATPSAPAISNVPSNSRPPPNGLNMDSGLDDDEEESWD
jgi:hypothetical protein